MAVHESDVVRVVRGFKAAVLAKEAKQMAELADRYLQVELSLEDQIAALAANVAALQAEGRATYWAINRLESYQRFQLKMLTALDDYNRWAAENIREEQLAFFGLGEDHAAATLETVKPGISVPLSAGERERILSMVGFASDGSPLANLLAASGDFVRATVTQKLVQAVATAQNPRITAREIRKATGMALNRAMAIARTEQMRVYRDTTLAGYREAGVQYYQRIAARDPATCIACLSMDGEISTTEASVDDHVNGRCSSIPIVPGVENPMAEPSQQWFDRQGEATQRAMMGPGRYDLYRSGQVNWNELGKHTHDPVWGGSIQPVPVRDLAVAQMAAA